MLRLAPGSRIFMAVKPVDMRRSFDGLCATITEALGGDPLSGDVFLFRGKRADRIKAIAWDRTGLAIRLADAVLSAPGGSAPTDDA
jgi:transposase